MSGVPLTRRWSALRASAASASATAWVAASGTYAEPIRYTCSAFKVGLCTPECYRRLRQTFLPPFCRPYEQGSMPLDPVHGSVNRKGLEILVPPPPGIVVAPWLVYLSAIVRQGMRLVCHPVRALRHDQVVKMMKTKRFDNNCIILPSFGGQPHCGLSIRCVAGRNREELHILPK